MWKKRAKKNFSNEKRENLSDVWINKGLYYNQCKWVEEYENSGLSYSEALDENLVKDFPLDYIRDASDKEGLQSSSNKDYKGGKTQRKKDNEITERNENFYCYTITDAPIPINHHLIILSLTSIWK